MSGTDLVARIALVYSEADSLVGQSKDAPSLALVAQEAAFYGAEFSALGQRASEKSVDVPL